MSLIGFVDTVAQEWKKALVDAEDHMRRPEIHLTNMVTNEVVQFCMLPEEIRVRTASNFRSYNIIERGEVKLPKGERLTSVTWNGLLPSARMLLYSFIQHAVWEQPIEIVRALTRWRVAGDKLRLLITQTAVNMDVYLKTFDTEYAGAHGHIKYTIDFIAAKEMKIMTVEEADAQKARAKESSAFEIQRRAAMKSNVGARIAQINGIWELALIVTGNGGDWERLADLNGWSDPANIDLSDPTTWVMY